MRLQSLGYPWWSLFAMFLVFDFSAVGYLVKGRTGPILYNAVHNYTGPAALAIFYTLGYIAGTELWVVGLIAGCWGFHVAVDRALGYGLKTMQSFQHTHLGMIGRRTPKEASTTSS